MRSDTPQYAAVSGIFIGRAAGLAQIIGVPWRSATPNAKGITPL